ncbi:twin-arginine translocase subunit TatC [Pontiella sulfatireligans]|uniref:Sec-independent protein translocase protein TatC n=1 Tax=Pontiella sulfatireligans TaxID=2750658 RepID=A0A6C2UKL4_9BACT|nr:twin-arginine translocase subunit TatC [Pontiella sulfatireligans]VGO20780.1 Sec-independent protein translocase protein TatC [Pontiella sulfatireligans]
MIEKLKSLTSKFRYDDSEMPFLEHLEEFRKTVIRSAIAIIIGMGACAYFVPWLTDVLREPAQQYIDSGQIVLQHPEVTSGFKMWVTIALWGGILVSMPALTIIIGSFIMPGIKDTERKIVRRVSGFAGVLFIVGVLLGYKVTLPLAMKIMWGFTDRLGGEAIWNYQKFIGFTLQVLLGFGVAFQLPIVIILLGKLGVLNAQQLKEKRRHVIVALFILAMLLTPPDITTQILMAVPLILLYEFCIWFLHFSQGREKAGTADETPEDPAPEDSEETEPETMNKTNEE